jgi:hypothetical protein
MSNPQKAKGTAWETAIVRFLREAGLYAIKPRQEGTRDVGDVHVEGLVVLQAKNYRDLATGIREGIEGVAEQRLHAGLPFGFAVVKRARKPVEEAYVVLRLGDLPDLVRALDGRPALSDPDHT